MFLDCHVIENINKIIGVKNVKLNESMSNHTSIKTGGPADILVMPESIQAIVDIISYLRKLEIPFFVMGKGTNLLVSDKGIRGVVIKTCSKLNGLSVNDDCLDIEAGVLLSKAANYALTKSLAGMEFASGIPGTIGGAVVMNAGAYGGEMKDIVNESLLMDSDGNLITLNCDDHEFGYRKSIIQGNEFIVLKTSLRLKHGDNRKISELMYDLNMRRKEKQPLDLPSAGSVFRRPEGHFVPPLIQECGLKGYSIGGACISEKHCGFIINRDSATSSDIAALIEHIQKIIMRRYGVSLEPEIKMVGEWV